MTEQEMCITFVGVEINNRPTPRKGMHVKWGIIFYFSSDTDGMV